MGNDKKQENQEAGEALSPESKYAPDDALSDKKVRQKQVGSRLGTYRRHLGLDYDDFESKTGIPVSTQKKYESGVSMPGGEAIAGLIKAGLNANWLLTGDGEMQVNAIASYSGAGNDEDYAYVPKMVDVEVSAGAGSVPSDSEATEELAFRRTWLADEGLSARNLRLVTSKGDSMTPTIPEGATLLVDISQNEFLREGIYVIRLDGHLYAKRLQRGQAGSLLLISDNPLYRQVVLEPGQQQVDIVGRVVWLGHTV